jgi:hypothetical protein
MVRPREFYINLLGIVAIVIWQFFFLGLFAVGYLPDFPTLPFAQQLTVGVAIVLATAFTAAMLFMFAMSIIYERPGRRRRPGQTL